MNWNSPQEQQKFESNVCRKRYTFRQSMLSLDQLKRLKSKNREINTISSSISFKSELIAFRMAKENQAVAVAKVEWYLVVLKVTLKDMFLEEFMLTEEGLQDWSDWNLKYGFGHLVVTCRLVLIPVFHFTIFLCSKAFMIDETKVTKMVAMWTSKERVVSFSVSFRWHEKTIAVTGRETHIIVIETEARKIITFVVRRLIWEVSIKNCRSERYTLSAWVICKRSSPVKYLATLLAELARLTTFSTQQV